MIEDLDDHKILRGLTDLKRAARRKGARDSEDLVQLSLLESLRQAAEKGFSRLEEVFRMAQVVLRNKVVDQYRTDQVRQFIPIDRVPLLSDADAMDNHLATQERMALVKSVVARFPVRDQQLWSMMLADWSPLEIAEALGLDQDTVRDRTRKLREKIRKCYQRELIRRSNRLRKSTGAHGAAVE